MINNLTGREKVLMAVFLLLLLLSGFFRFFMLPAYWAYRDARDEILDIKNGHKTEKEKDSIISREAALLGKTRADWEELKRRYAISGRQDAFITHLGELAREHNITVSSIGCGRTSVAEGIIIQPFQIKFNGQYKDIIAASGDLEKGNYCLDVKVIKFEQPEGKIPDNVEDNTFISGSLAENPEAVDSFNLIEAPVTAAITVDVYFMPDE